jgi:ectoine hydroxylase-related dioxygenase (phytanoyl-CoA dioxygenase family)
MYRRDGYLVLPRRFPAAQVSDWLRECDRLWATVRVERDNARVQWRALIDGGDIADRIDPVLDISPLFQALAYDPSLVSAAADALDGTADVFKAKLIAKRPGTVGYKMHQDHPYWEFLGAPPDDYVNVLVAFDTFDRASGATEVFPGLHRSRVPAPPDQPLDADESRMDTSAGVLIELEPGDVALFHSMIPHRSAPNHGARQRRGLFLTYIASRHRGLMERYHRDRIALGR